MPLSASTFKIILSIPLVVDGLCFSIQWLYDYVGLLRLHLFYLSSMSNPPEVSNDPHRSREVWISLVEDLFKRGHNTLHVAAMCTMCVSMLSISLFSDSTLR